MTDGGPIDGLGYAWVRPGLAFAPSPPARSRTNGQGLPASFEIRASGPGDRVSLPYFPVDDVPAALARVEELGGAVIHSGGRWAICRDSEGSPFGLGPALD